MEVTIKAQFHKSSNKQCRRCVPRLWDPELADLSVEVTIKAQFHKSSNKLCRRCVPRLWDPEPADLSVPWILLVLQRVILSQNAHVLTCFQRAAHHATKHMEHGRVGCRVQLCCVHHQRTLHSQRPVRYELYYTTVKVKQHTVLSEIHLRTMGCHLSMGSHNVICHPTEMSTLPSPQQSTLVLDL